MGSHPPGRNFRAASAGLVGVQSNVPIGTWVLIRPEGDTHMQKERRIRANENIYYHEVDETNNDQCKPASGAGAS